MENVLIIEKNSQLIEIIEHLLQEEGCSVETVSTDKAALEKIKEQKFDLVFCGRHEDEDEENPIRYMLLSGYGENEAPIKIIKVKAAEYRQFPTNIAPFLKAVRTGLQDYRNIIQNKEIFKRQRESLFNIIKILIDAIEERDKYWKGHSARVTDLAIKTGNIFNFPEEREEILKWAGYLHDIGSATTKLSLLHKTEKLMEEEKEQLKSLPIIALELLSPMSDLKEVARVIFHKSEKFDGSGYPSGLKGKDIPLESRILNVTETYDSLTNWRPYRASFSHEEAVKIIQEGIGTKYDPQVVKNFLLTFTDEYEKSSSSKKSINEQARLLITLGDSYREMGNYKDAQDAYSECLDLRSLPSSHMIDALIGISYLNFCQGRYSQAEIMARAAKDKSKEMSSLKEGQANLILGLILGMQGDISQAESLLDGAAKIFKEWDYNDFWLQSRLYLARVYTEFYGKEKWDEEKFKKSLKPWLEQYKEQTRGFFFRDMLPAILTGYTVREFKDSINPILDKIENLRREIENIKWNIPEKVKFALLDWIKISGDKGIKLGQYFFEDDNEDLKKEVRKILDEIGENKEGDLKIFSESPLMIYGFGIPRILIKGKLTGDKKWNTRKSKLLFLYLISQGNQKVPEDKIIDMFWTDSSTEKARQNLYNAVYHIRRVLGNDLGIPVKEVVNIHQSTYQINPGISCWYDVNEFEKLHNSGLSGLETEAQEDNGIADFKEAVDLYKGRFLETYYEDWTINYGYQLQEKFIYMLKELSRFYIKKGEHQTAISYAQRILSEDVCDQDGHYLIMDCYFRQGKNEQVVRQYLSCCQTLQEEMDITPSQNLKDLYLKVKG